MAEWDGRAWPRGAIVIHEGRVGKLYTAPDKQNKVRLEWVDGSKSTFIPISELRRAADSDWEEAKREDDHHYEQQLAEQSVKALELRSGGAPPPRGVDAAMALTGEADLRVAFDMLDERSEGALDRSQARNWLRCAGWCLPDEELDEMLTSISGPGCLSRSGVQHGRTKWGLKNLMEVIHQNRHRENSSVEALQNALRRLAHSRGKIQRDRLVEYTTQDHDLTEVNLNEVLASLGLASANTLDVDTLALRMLERVCSPPSVLDMNNFGR